jgi:hypothetical protein
MAGSELINVTEADIQTVAQKLEKFCDELPASEQVVMGWLLQRAGEAEDVQGFESKPLRKDQVRTAVMDAVGFSVPR